MKNLLLTLEHPPHTGGIATYVEQFAHALGGERVIVMAPVCAQEKSYDTGAAYPIIRQQFFYPWYIWPRWLRSLLPCMRLVRKQNIETLLVHHVLPLGYVALILFWLYRVPYIIFYHGTDVFAGTRSTWKRRMMYLVARHAKRNIFDSTYVERAFVRFFPTLQNTTTVAPPGITSSSLVKESVVAHIRRTYHLQENKVILSVGRLVEGKGFMQLIQSIPAILRQVPNLSVLIVGDGPERDKLERYIHELSLSSVVQCVGSVKHHELLSFYHVADAFVLLTHAFAGREEGFGLAFLEASHAGLPIVAGKSGGVEDIIIHNKTGLLVDAMNQEEVVRGCVEVLTNTHKAKQLGSQARDRAEKDFSWLKTMEILQPYLS